MSRRKRSQYLTWCEPVVIRRIYYPSPVITKWAHVRFAVVLLIFSILPLIVPAEEQAEALWIMPLMGVLCGVLAGYAIPFLDSRAGSTISIGPAGVERRDSVLGLVVPILMLVNFRTRQWNWHQIGSCKLIVTPIRGKDHRILELLDHAGEVIGVVGVPRKLEESVILSCLSANGCELEG